MDLTDKDTKKIEAVRAMPDHVFYLTWGKFCFDSRVSSQKAGWQDAGRPSKCIAPALEKLQQRLTAILSEEEGGD